MIPRSVRLSIPLVVALVTALMGTGVAASSPPTGEVTLGQSVIEPGYNDINGSPIYFLTPNHAIVHPNDSNTAPLYIIMYPTSSADSVGTLDCQHQPLDNCPDHGPQLAQLAEALVPSVYGHGVWGHDHILDAPASPPSKGGDFNIVWEPVVVLFTNAQASNTHITTKAQLQAAKDSGDVTEIRLPTFDFYCSVVNASVYNQGTPVTPVSSNP